MVLGLSAAVGLWAFEFGKDIAGLDHQAHEELQQLRRERGETLPGGAWRLRASQAELAQLAGVTRQTANEWLRASAVTVGYRQLGGTADQPSSRRK